MGNRLFRLDDPMDTMTEDIRKYDFIDALRGYAILLVLLVHSSQSAAPINQTLQMLMNGGAHGVQLFYIASALTLCMSWRFRSTHEKSPVRNFFLRRFFRIAPMFYVAIVFYVLLYGFSPRYWAPYGIEWWFVPLTALFLHGFHPETIASVVPGGWSIAVEMNFYLVLPYLLHRLTTIKSSIYFFLFSLGIHAISRLAFEHLFSGIYPTNQQYLVPNFIFLNFFGQLPVFAIGISAYFAFSNIGLLKRVVSFGSLLFIVSLVLLMLLPSSSIITRLLGNYVTIGAAFALFAITLGVFPIKVLVNRVVTHVGKISFSMYLSHFAVLHFFSKFGISTLFEKGDTSSILHFLCIVAVTAVISYILYITIERQGILLGKRVIDRLEQSATPDAPKAARR
ncbi:MAG: acyltransferase family protein [Methylococcales bacterium]